MVDAGEPQVLAQSPVMSPPADRRWFANVVLAINKASGDTARGSEYALEIAQGRGPYKEAALHWLGLDPEQYRSGLGIERVTRPGATTAPHPSESTTDDPSPQSLPTRGYGPAPVSGAGPSGGARSPGRGQAGAPNDQGAGLQREGPRSIASAGWVAQGCEDPAPAESCLPVPWTAPRGGANRYYAVTDAKIASPAIYAGPTALEAHYKGGAAEQFETAGTPRSGIQGFESAEDAIAHFFQRLNRRRIVEIRR